jgi:hypothetical protein
VTEQEFVALSRLVAAADAAASESASRPRDIEETLYGIADALAMEIPWDRRGRREGLARRESSKAERELSL